MQLRGSNYAALTSGPSNSCFYLPCKKVARFAASISGDEPNFVAMSYPELWKSWEAYSEPKWLPVHVDRLKARYGVEA